MGFRLPSSLRAHLDSSGPLKTSPTLLNPSDLFDAYVHIECARSAGIKDAEHWLIFAMEDDYDHAYIFDDRFGEKEYSTGFYHQDDVCERPLSSNERLPDSCENFTEWFEKHQNLMDEQTVAPQNENELNMWTPSNWRTAFRKTADLGIVKKIIEEVRIPILQRAKVTGVKGPVYLYPQSLDLLYRLAPEGKRGRRDLAREVLQLSGVVHEDERLKRAEEILTRKCENPESVTEEQTCKHLIICSEIAWKTREPLNHPNQKNALYARALLWALGKAEPERIWESMLLVMKLNRMGRTHPEAKNHGLVPPLSRHLDQDFLWDKLEGIILPSSLGPRTEALDYKIFVSWLESSGLPQLHLWKSIKDDWFQRLEKLNEDEKRDVINVIKKVIKHNQVTSERDAFLRKLER